MSRPCLLLLTAVLAVGAARVATASPSAPAAAPSHCAEVKVDPSDTSIYVGSVSLSIRPLTRSNGVYRSDYTAKVFPYFFFSEHGTISIDVSDDLLRRIERGEAVDFTGHANNSEGKERRIEGQAVPAAAGADHGKMKVRVWVGKHLELVFNTVYRFTGKE